MTFKRRRVKILFKKFLKLRINIKINNKIFKFRKKKWETFIEIVSRQNMLPNRVRPFTQHSHYVSKFASQGNSLKNKFRNNLVAKKMFNYAYGNYLKKYLKKHTKYFFNQKSLEKPEFLTIEFLESRLDSVLHKSKFCFSIKHAKQLISHKHVTVNGEIKKNKSYILKTGDRISLVRNFFYLLNKNLISKYKGKSNYPIPPKYLIINYKTLEIIFGKIKKFNFLTSFYFKLKVHNIMTAYYQS